MADFKRGMGQKLTEKLGAEELFIHDLKPDIVNGKVFFAIRPGYGSFYVKGNSLFSYKRGGFSTHQKFGFVPRNIKNDYIRESQLGSLRAITSFHQGYEEIKKRTEPFARIEAEGVSALYRFAPTENNLDERYFLVDIEIAFDAANDPERDGESSKTDRIDMLLYDNQDRQLLFCEAKHYSNTEIWAGNGNVPKVVGQLEKYDRQIAANRQTILTQYAKAFDEYNQLMGTKLNPPENIFFECGLYIFGFNREQQGELKKIIQANSRFYGHRCRIIGNTQHDTPEKIYKVLT